MCYGPAMQNRRLRRSLTGILAILGIAGLLAVKSLAPARAAAPPSSASPADALKLLLEGNQRFVDGKPERPNQDTTRRAALVGGQQPFAAILSCSDSRTAPEVIFDRGLGDLFVVRNAGNVVDDVTMASIEYSVIHLGSSLVMVLGHEHCGAVSATVDALAGKSNPEDKDSKIAALASIIAPAVKAVPASAPDKVEAGVMENARLGAHLLLTHSPPLGAHVRDGKL